jgi:hypothetical protein
LKADVMANPTAAACRLNSVMSSICDASHEKPRETCV